MIKNNFNAQGYKAPVCKVVRVAMKAQLLQSSVDEVTGLSNFYVGNGSTGDESSDWGY